MAKRLVSAGIIIPLLIIYIMKLPATYFTGLLVFVGMTSQYEFYSMYKLKGILSYAGLFLGISIYVATDAYPSMVVDLLVFSVMALTSIRLFSKKDPSALLMDLAPALTGLFYVPLLFAQQILIRQQGPEWIIFLLGIVWSADAMALFFGMKFGKRKLYASVSPKKTVEGAVGSLTGGLLSALILQYFLELPAPMGVIVFTGVFLGIVSIIGDLVESMFKRDAGIKDSGALIPGHGGLLDKIDALLFAGPAMYWSLKWLRIFN